MINIGKKLKLGLLGFVIVPALVIASTSLTNTEDVIPFQSVRSTLIPEPLPYQDDFENETTWGWSNDTFNQWVIGTAVNNGGTHALYISNDNGESNAYDVNEVQVSHVYKDFIIPNTALDLSVRFDWRNVGERRTDDFRVWLVPILFTPQPGERITAFDSGGIQLDNNQFSGQRNFQTLEIQREITRFAGQTMRLVFEWKNDDSEGNQPPAALDNLRVLTTSCAMPSELELTDITPNSAEITWEEAEDITNYELWVSTSPIAPANDAIASFSNVSSPYILDDLEPNTQYYVWVRSRCSATEKSLWQGELSVFTTQLVETLPFSDDFEDGFNWRISDEAKNKWAVGTAISNGGTKALYISDDEGENYHADMGFSAISHVYRDFEIPEGAEELTLTFDWHIVGDIMQSIPIEYFRVIKIPVDYTPESNDFVDTSEEGVLLGRPYYIQSEGWKTEAIAIDVRENQGEAIRLVFEWINYVTESENLPAAIDNISLVVSNCQSPTNLNAEMVRYTNNVRFSWVPQGSETKWEVYTTIQGETPPDVNTTAILVEGEPTLLIENIEEGNYFVYYVRTICEGEEETEKTAWAGPYAYSYFVPFVCTDLEGGIDDMPYREDDTYVICEDGPVTKKLSAQYFDSKKTNDYEVEAIEYNPPFPFFGGDMVRLTKDDEWSDVIDLGFDFCFYGNKYNKVLISTNGAITFSIKDLVEGGRYTPGGESKWSFSESIPFLPTDVDAPFVDAIFGVFQDSDPLDSPIDHTINYQILGTFPCRVLVFNVYQLGMYECAYDPDDIEGSTQTSQIVLYEGTNIIEVYVKNRKPCMDWQDGVGLIGIQGNDGIQGIAAPNRNTGDWTTSNEAWRFTPKGEPSVDFAWYKNGTLFSREETIEVEVTKSVTYTAKVSYEACEGSELVIERNFHFLKDDFDFTLLPDYHQCGSTNDSGGQVKIDISETTALIQDHLGVEQDNYTIAYYEDEALTQPVDELVAVSSRKTIYVKLENQTTLCFQVGTFDLVRTPPVTVTKLDAIEACESLVLPPLKEGEQYFTASLGQGVEYHPGDTYEVLGDSILYIYKKEENGCEGESQWKIYLDEKITADVLDDQIMQCEIFVLPALSEFNAYYTAPNKGGMLLTAGMKIDTPMTLYIYATRSAKESYCFDESSFTVTYEDCPLPRGFSPNGDGINDSFDLSDYGVSKIQVFNRYGIEVYKHGANYTNQFVGKDKSGNKLPSGTYYYILISHGKQRTGWVQLNY